MSENENAGFSRKDWPLWLLIYLLVSLLYNLCNAVPGPWYAWLALVSIFVLAFSCLQVWKKYIDCQKFISRYVLFLTGILFFAAPVWIKSLGGSIVNMDLDDYAEGMIAALWWFQYFAGPFYALLLLPFVWFLTKYRVQGWHKGQVQKIRLTDVFYMVFISVWPLVVIWYCRWL